MKISENFPLGKLNTFGIAAKAKYYTEINTIEDLLTLVKEPLFKNSGKLILGGGSNILFTKDFDGLVIKNNILGKELIREDKKHYYVKTGAGENWHEFVQYCIANDYAGIENLSLILGNVGASPMQNIGAYGVEIKDVFDSLEAFDIESGSTRNFTGEECRFGYRESVFKNIYKSKYIIVSVTFKLNKTPKFNTSYGAIEQELERMGVQELSIAAIGQAVCNIRMSKLPDPKEIGNAGSFFKNPVVSQEIYEKLKKDFPDIPAYPQMDGSVKLAAGWLIEQCGMKGYREGDTGIHEKQALVLVNYGNAKGNDIYALSEKVFKKVKEKFGVLLEREVNVI